MVVNDGQRYLPFEQLGPEIKWHFRTNFKHNGQLFQILSILYFGCYLN